LGTQLPVAAGLVTQHSSQLEKSGRKKGRKPMATAALSQPLNIGNLAGYTSG